MREERPGDESAVRRVHQLAFGGELEPALVEELRRCGACTLALVADVEGAVVGHVLFSPVHVPGAVSGASCVALAPIAVLPERQRQGIGTALVAEALRRLRAAGHAAVVVLGDPAYYSRFGFVPAGGFDLACKWAANDTFQALELRPGALADAGGCVEYHSAFDVC